MTAETRKALVAKLALMRRCNIVLGDHLALLGHSIAQDDVDVIMCGREASHNALEFLGDLMGEVGREPPDWRPAVAPVSSTLPDGYLGATE